MTVEKTITFIQSTQAGVSAQLADLNVKQARKDRQIHGLQVLVKTGMKMLVRMQQSVKAVAAEQKRTHQELRVLGARTDASLRESAIAQKRTDERFERWLARGSNGGGQAARVRPVS